MTNDIEENSQMSEQSQLNNEGQSNANVAKLEQLMTQVNSALIGQQAIVKQAVSYTHLTLPTTPYV